MMRAIVFSKDRPLQLEACLRSFFRHAGSTEGVALQVIYAASSQRFLGQYEMLAKWYSGRAEFLQEADFRLELLNALASSRGDANAGASAALLRTACRPWRRKNGAGDAVRDFVLFVVDDTIFVRRFDLGAAQTALLSHPQALGLSLRLGVNTTRSYAMARAQASPEWQAASGDFLLFEWLAADGDFGYPLELSSSMYRIGDVLPLLRKLKFSDPNTLESQLSLQARKFADKRPAMLCPRLSVAFSAPVNRVQAVFENRSGTDPQWSTQRLADQFDEGQRIDVTHFDEFTPTACHQEVSFVFEPRR